MEGFALDNAVLLSVALAAAALLFVYMSRKLRSNQVGAFLFNFPQHRQQRTSSRVVPACLHLPSSRLFLNKAHDLLGARNYRNVAGNLFVCRKNVDAVCR